MPRFMQWTLWTALLPTLFWMASPLSAGLVMTVEPSVAADLDSSVLFSFSGSGTVSEGGSGSVLDFLNFDANVFDLLPDGSNDFIMDVVFEGIDASSMSSYTQTFQSIRLNDQSSGDDILLRDAADSSFSFDIDDTYTVMGAATLSDLKFSDLVPGIYEASLTSGDGIKFGGAQLNIATASVPEPSSFVCFTMILGYITIALHLRARRRRS